MIIAIKKQEQMLKRNCKYLHMWHLHPNSRRIYNILFVERIHSFRRTRRNASNWMEWHFFKITHKQIMTKFSRWIRNNNELYNRQQTTDVIDIRIVIVVFLHFHLREILDNDLYSLQSKLKSEIRNNLFVYSVMGMNTLNVWLVNY